MERKAIIQKSFSTFATPTFILIKKNGKIRLIHDFVALNKITIKDGFPFPSLEEVTVGIKDARWFSTIDLDYGFYQIPIRKIDQSKTAFTVPSGHYEYLKMLFGLCNAPRTFKQTLQNLFEDFKRIKIFVDDILIFSNSKFEYEKDIKKTLKRLLETGAKINCVKSKFYQAKIEYLGLIIDSEGIRCNTKKIPIACNSAPSRDK